MLKSMISNDYYLHFWRCISKWQTHPFNSENSCTKTHVIICEVELNFIAIAKGHFTSVKLWMRFIFIVNGPKSKSCQRTQWSYSLTNLAKRIAFVQSNPQPPNRPFSRRRKDNICITKRLEEIRRDEVKKRKTPRTTHLEWVPRIQRQERERSLLRHVY